MQNNFPLLALNTLGIDAKAHAYVQLTSLDDVLAVWRDVQSPQWQQSQQLPRLVLGGGSNIVLTGDFPGLVLHMCNKGIALVKEDEHAYYVQAQAGESWHQLVLWTLKQGWGGLENLSLIPGSVGAAPVQNIGAYGAELKDYLHALTMFDFETGQISTLNNADCAFAYRDSIFKHALRERAIILDVTLALPKRWQANLTYPELAQALQTDGLQTPSAQQISDAVIAIRRRKLPDPALIGNVGSFFKNPIIDANQHVALLQQYPQLPSYVLPDGKIKLAAGWLIQQCGWKGKSMGGAGVYDKQALVLINRGGASGQDIAQLAAAIQKDVLAQFGVALEVEPVFA